MAQAKFDIAEKLDLYFRKARAGSKVFTFQDADEVAYDVSGITWQLNIKSKSGSNIIQLLSGTGLTISTNTITVSISETQSNIPETLYFWELYDATNKKTWLCGSAQFVTKDPSNISDSETITVNTNPDEVTVTISSGGLGSTSFIGPWDASGNTLPSGASAGDTYYFSVGGNVATYGQSATDWPAGTLATYLGSSNWRLY
jgi:hypothetical protein